MVKRFFLAMMAGLLLAGSAASADVNGPVSLSTQRTDTCQVGDTCENTFTASWEGVPPAPVGGTLRVEANGTEFSTQEFAAKFAMTVSVPPKTKKITFSSGWRLRGGATALHDATAGCSVSHSQVGYISVTPIFYADGTYGLVPVVGYGVPVSAEFTFTEVLQSSKNFPRTMTLWAELYCTAYGTGENTPSWAEVTLSPESGDGLGTALLHLHATFSG